MTQIDAYQLLGETTWTHDTLDLFTFQITVEVLWYDSSVEIYTYQLLGEVHWYDPSPEMYVYQVIGEVVWQAAGAIFTSNMDFGNSAAAIVTIGNVQLGALPGSAIVTSGVHTKDRLNA